MILNRSRFNLNSQLRPAAIVVLVITAAAIAADNKDTKRRLLILSVSYRRQCCPRPT